PREKLARQGVRALASRELLALLLGTGTRSVSALVLADLLLAKFGSLQRVMSASVEELTSQRGVGTAKAALLAAAYEVGRRTQAPAADDTEPVRTAADIARRMRPYIHRLDREEV